MGVYNQNDLISGLRDIAYHLGANQCPRMGVIALEASDLLKELTFRPARQSVSCWGIFFLSDGD